MSRQRVPSGDPAIAVAYVRVSTEDQHLGPDAQRAAIDAWAGRQGVTIAACFVDHGVSGASELDARPGLAAAVTSLRTHTAGLLVVARRDRLARDTVVAGLIERAVARARARVVAADGAGNGAGPADEFMRTVIDGAAAYERALIRARTSAALQAKRARGERAGTTPWGYRANADGQLEPDAGERGITRRIEALREAGLTHRAIVGRLTDEGLRGRRGKPLAKGQVQRILAAASRPS